MNKVKWLFIALCILPVFCENVEDKESFGGSKVMSKVEVEENFLQKLNQKCIDNDNSSCVMLKLLNYMNKLLKKSSFTISKKITLLQTSLSRNQSETIFNQLISSRNIQNDDAVLSMLVVDKVWQFIKSRALKWKMTDFSDLLVSAGDRGKINVGVSVDAKRALIEGRGKIKNTGPLIAAIILKGALIGILAFKALFLLSGKALLISKLAFLLSSLIGVKKLLSGSKGGKHVSYEIINDHHRNDAYMPPTPAGQPPAGWQRAFDMTVDSFIENFAKKFTETQ